MQVALSIRVVHDELRIHLNHVSLKRYGPEIDPTQRPRFADIRGRVVDACGIGLDLRVLGRTFWFPSAVANR